MRGTWPLHLPAFRFAIPPTRADIALGTVHQPGPDELPRRLGRLSSVLRSSADGREQAQRLMRMGRRMKQVPLLARGPHTRVDGCVSVVHVLVRVDGRGRLSLAAAADSRLAAGLAALIVRGLQGEPLNSLLQLEVEHIAAASNLSLALTPGRLNGLEGILRTMRRQLQEHHLHGNESEVTAGSVMNATNVPMTLPSGAEASNPRLLWPAAEEEVAVLLSGGVDSSVALHQLLSSGYRCRAFYLRIWLEDEQAHAARGSCPWEEDWEYCQAVCNQAGVPLEAVSLQSEYQQQVVSYLVTEAATGRTPNPDIMCNSRIKFGVFHDRIGKHFSRVASGHYARSQHAHDRVTGARTARLLRSADEHKDQTYFLSQLRQVRRWGRLSKHPMPKSMSDLVPPCAHPRTKFVQLCFRSEE